MTSKVKGASVVTVLDVSNFDYQHFDVDCLRANGVTGIILGCQNEMMAYEMAERAKRGGLPILATYAFLYFGFAAGIGPEVIKAYKVASDYHVPYVALDVEARPPNEAPGQTPASRATQLRQAIGIVESGSNGLKPIIYTFPDYWRREMGNTTEFTRYPLWLAHWLSGTQPIPFERRDADFGGWTKVAIHQWTSSLQVCGRRRDANHVFDLEVQEMSAEHQQLVEAIGAALTGGRTLAEMKERLRQWNHYPPGHQRAGERNGNSLLDGYILRATDLAIVAEKLRQHIDQHPATTADPELRRVLLEELDDITERLESLIENAEASTGTSAP